MLKLIIVQLSTFSRYFLSTFFADNVNLYYYKTVLYYRQHKYLLILKIKLQ